MVQVLNMQQSLGQTPSSACCSPIKPGRDVLRADALALSAWLVQGLAGKWGLVLYCCPSAPAAAWLEMLLRRRGIAAYARFPVLASLPCWWNVPELLLLSGMGMGMCQSSRCPLGPGGCPCCRCRISAWLLRSQPLPSTGPRCRAGSRCSAGGASTAHGTRACRTRTTSVLSPWGRSCNTSIDVHEWIFFNGNFISCVINRSGCAHPRALPAFPVSCPLGTSYWDWLLHCSPMHILFFWAVQVAVPLTRIDEKQVAQLSVDLSHHHSCSQSRGEEQCHQWDWSVSSSNMGQARWSCLGQWWPYLISSFSWVVCCKLLPIQECD